MSRSAISVVISLVAIILVLGAVLVLVRSRKEELSLQAVTTSTPSSTPLTAASNIPKALPSTTLRASSIPNVSSDFTFIANIPPHWQAEAVSGSAAINLYDPAVAGNTALEKSQIFIRSFSANQFLTLPTVTIMDRAERIINSRPAVRYIIEKKATVPTFPDQPSWRSQRHTVTDIRVADTNPSIFYVIAKRPDLAQETYENFLQTLTVTDTPIEPLTLPIDGFKERITKKQFGIYITTSTSPVQPERFTGYHTGVDVEYGDVADADDVPVRAITAGRVVAARTAAGYGGVVAIEHTIAGTPRLAIYGHLDPESLPKTDQRVAAGEQIGVLGAGNTSETDNERQHLHFAILKSNRLDLRGYVPREAELIAWQNPLELF